MEYSSYRFGVFFNFSLIMALTHGDGNHPCLKPFALEVERVMRLGCPVIPDSASVRAMNQYFVRRLRCMSPS